MNNAAILHFLGDILESWVQSKVDASGPYLFLETSKEVFTFCFGFMLNKSGHSIMAAADSVVILLELDVQWD